MSAGNLTDDALEAAANAAVMWTLDGLSFEAAIKTVARTARLTAAEVEAMRDYLRENIEDGSISAPPC